MAEARDNAGSSLQRTSSATWWPSDFTERFGSISLDSEEETLGLNGPRNAEHDALPSQTASEVLWSTGMLSGPIPNGFYSVIPDKKLKERFFSIPTLEELQTLGAESARVDTILVDFKKDKKLSMLKQLAATLVRGMNSNPAAVIKKIAGLVSDVYKKPNSDSTAKHVLEEASNMLENRVVQMLGQIKQGSCRPRAILFKVLADAVGLDSRLMVGLPNDGGAECEDSYKHMSVMVSLNSVELLVDLMRFPGQLIPRSTKAIFTTHIFPAGESDSAENDSCDSPLEPNSPMYGYPESAEKDDSLFPKTPDAYSNTPGPSRNILMRSTTFVDSRLNVSRSEPNIAATFWRRGRRKAVAELRTASSSPEHPSFQGRRSILSGDKNSNKDCADVTSTSRSDGSSTPETRRIRRRSMSMTPEIGDDIVRAVRAMNETMKQNRLMTEQRDELSGGMSPSYGRDHFMSQKAISLPTSPHEYTSQTSERSRTVPPSHNDEMVSVWNRVLGSPMFQNKPLLPYDDWNIDFSEIAVGIRVGIGSFGEVFRGMWNGTEVAIKLFLEQDLTAENMEDFCNEISILSRLRHPNVILFLGACTKPPRLSMITEYMEHGSLYYLIHSSGQKNKLSWRRRLKMIRDLCRGLMCIHRMKVVHRDLKSANCLVNKHWTVKICDFGLSRIATDLPMRDSSCAGTPEWMAPELIRNEQFTEKCDIFSLGVIMWELCTLSRPWDRVPPERVVYSVANEGSRLEIPDGPLKNLISDCWAEAPNERPSCDEVLSRLLDCEYSLC